MAFRLCKREGERHGFSNRHPYKTTESAGTAEEFGYLSRPYDSSLRCTQDYVWAEYSRPCGNDFEMLLSRRLLSVKTPSESPS
jgi:hypothetical protein